MPNTHPSIDGFLRKAKKWRDEMIELRRIVLECGLTENMKWRQPCYTVDDGNVVIISPFKDHCVLSFFKGALLKDPHDVLDQPGPNTRSGRVIRFTSVAEILEMEPILKACINEAVENEKAGRTVDFQSEGQLELPEELRQALDDDPEFKAAFEALTPGRQRGYLIYFSGAKQSKTRAGRVERARERIFEGKGVND